MKLTRHTDYALRMLLYLAAHPGRLCSIAEIARAYDISQNHLMKVANELGRIGHIETVRGRNGGLRLARPANEIILGKVVRDMEEGFDLVDCDGCVIVPVCGLPGVLRQATRAFVETLDRYSLADIGGPKGGMAALFGVPPY